MQTVILSEFCRIVKKKVSKENKEKLSLVYLSLIHI